MSKDNKHCSPNGWTTDTLEKHLSGKIEDLKALIHEHDLRNQERFATAREAVTIATVSAEKALLKSDAASERRWEVANEFRGTLSDQAATLLSRNEYNINHDALVEKFNNVNERLLILEAGTRGRLSGINWIGALILGLFTVISAIAVAVNAFHIIKL